MRNLRGIIAVASVALIACSSSNPNTPVEAAPVQAAAAGDASVAANAVAFGALETDPSASSSNVPLAADDAATAASNAVQAAATSYTPSGCAIATAAGNTVNYTLNDCTGPLGATNMKGSMSVAFTSESDGLHVSITSARLTVGTDTVSLNRQGIFNSNGTSRTFQIPGDTGSSSGPFGSVVYESAQGSLTWTGGGTCATYNATEHVTAVLALVVTDVNIVRCNGQPCSKSGSATAVDPGGGSIVVTYTGTPTAPFRESNGNVGSLFLTCGTVIATQRTSASPNDASSVPLPTRVISSL